MDVITKNIARTLIATIGTDKISKIVADLIKTLVEEKNKLPLQDGEADIIGIVYEADGVAHFAQAAIRETEAETTEITRYISVSTIPDMVTKLFQNI